MDEQVRVLHCPQCGASLSLPGKFSKQVVCTFCETTVQVDPSFVPVARFREALRRWSSPASHGFSEWLSIGETAWAPRHLLAHGDVSSVFLADRARWPGERVVLKVLRDEQDRILFDREWQVLQDLHRPGEQARKPSTIPDPVVRGVIHEGLHEGHRAMAFRWAPGFVHTFEHVRAAYPSGIEASLGVWMWRRILETLAFLHRSGIVHGAILPSHLLVQQEDHGVRVVGFGCADREGASLRAIPVRYEDFYPGPKQGERRLTAAEDVRMSARCIAWVMGGDPTTGTVPARVPRPFADLMTSLAVPGGKDPDVANAWKVRERVGKIGRQVFGAPTFNPLRMPG